MDHHLAEGAKIAVQRCLALQPGESALIVTDPGCVKVAQALWEVVSRLEGEPVLALIRERRLNGEEPPKPVAEAMRTSDVCFLATTRSLTHTVARREASRAGSRIASMPGITTDIAARALYADYEGIAVTTEKVAAILDEGNSLHIKTPGGTDLAVDISGRKAVRDTGLYCRPGEFGNLPAGEAYIAPVEGSAKGVIVVDASMAGIASLQKPLVIDVASGRAASIEGGQDAAHLARLLDAAGDGARNIAEVGIGTNPAARVIGNVLEDEKVLGTVHVALGANASFGGMVQVPCHMDGVMLSPDVWVDGIQVLAQGRLLV